MNMKLNRQAFLNYDVARGTPKQNPFVEPEPESRPKPKPPVEKKPMAVYYTVGICAAMLQVAIIASATWLVLGLGKGNYSAEESMLVAARAILAASPNHEVTDLDFKAGKLTVTNLVSGKISSFSVADVKNGSIMLTNGDGDEIAVGPLALAKRDTGPTGFPQDLILYPGAVPRVISSDVSGESHSGAVEQTTVEPIASVIETFEKTLLTAGYTILSKRVSDESGSIESERSAPYRVITIELASEAGRTVVVIDYDFHK